MASTICAASVPNVVSSSPAAIAMRICLPCSISCASATAARASARLCETTTSPTVTASHPPAVANADAAAAISIAADVAPGSWCPTLRCPR